MSRNIRQKFPTTPIKVSKRRGSDSSSSLDLSDDGGYSGLEDISDSEDDDEDDVNAAEEKHILARGKHGATPSSPRPHGNNEQENDEDDDGEDDDEGDADDAEESASWDGVTSEPDDDEVDELLAEQQEAAVERRVRFDVPDSDGDSTETDDDVDHGFFPDLFVDKSTLDPSFRRELEHDADPYDSSNSEAYWDHYGTVSGGEGGQGGDTLFDTTGEDLGSLIEMQTFRIDDYTPIATPMPHQDPSTAVPTATSTPAASPEKDDVSLDGYQTDSEGDTTDEEEPPEKPIRRKTRREVVEEDSDSDIDTVSITRPRRGQPRVGRFNLDKSSKKPIAILNPKTGKMMIFTQQAMRDKGFDLSPEQFNFNYFEQVQSSPILSNPGNIMMSGMISSSTYGDFMNTHAVGPAEAWYAQATDGTAIEESEGSDYQVVDDEEKNLKLEDFITLDDDGGSSDDEKMGNPAADDDVFRTPARGDTNSDVTSLLSHFEHNANIVGAFRRDQANHNLISRSKATRESLAFSGPYYEGTLRGIKDGRLATTNVPISPLRKQKRAPELASSPLSSLSQKRKAPSEHQLGHKRQRSVPDVGPLRI